MPTAHVPRVTSAATAQTRTSSSPTRLTRTTAASMTAAGCALGPAVIPRSLPKRTLERVGEKPPRPVSRRFFPFRHDGDRDVGKTARVQRAGRQQYRRTGPTLATFHALVPPLCGQIVRQSPKAFRVKFAGPRRQRRTSIPLAASARYRRMTSRQFRQRGRDTTVTSHRTFAGPTRRGRLVRVCIDRSRERLRHITRSHCNAPKIAALSCDSTNHSICSRTVKPCRHRSAPSVAAARVHRSRWCG